MEYTKPNRRRLRHLKMLLLPRILQDESLNHLELGIGIDYIPLFCLFYVLILTYFVKTIFYLINTLQLPSQSGSRTCEYNN